MNTTTNFVLRTFAATESATRHAHSIANLNMQRLRAWGAIAAVLVLLACPFPTFAGQSGNTDNPIELTRAASLGYISYTIRGMDTSTKLHIEIRNHLVVSVEISIEQGTEFVPSQSGVQRMTVTKDYRILVRGHAHNEPEFVEVRDLDAACLDISRDAPSHENGSWSVRKPHSLQDFLTCLDQGLEEAKKDSPSLSTQLANMRAALAQLGLWQARGASRSQWIAFFVNYNHMKESDAAQLIDQLKPFLDSIVQGCGTLADI